MTTVQHDNLGKLVSLVDSEMTRISDFLDDPITVGSSCGDEFMPSMTRRARDRIEVTLRMAGFDSYDAFIDEVNDRTSDKWVYFRTSLLAWSGEHGPFYTREATR